AVLSAGPSWLDVPILPTSAAVPGGEGAAGDRPVGGGPSVAQGSSPADRSIEAVTGLEPDDQLLPGGAPDRPADAATAPGGTAKGDAADAHPAAPETPQGPAEGSRTLLPLPAVPETAERQAPPPPVVAEESAAE